MTRFGRHPAKTDPIAPDLLGRHFGAPAPNRVWVADITYIRTDEGFLYFAAIEDLFSRVMGWSMAPHLRTELVADALAMAITKRRPDEGLSITPTRAASTPRSSSVAGSKTAGSSRRWERLGPRATTLLRRASSPR